MRPMGSNQIAVLRLLYQGREYPGGGWEWDNRSTTVRLLESLVRRGYAETYEVPTRYQGTVTHYRITTNGKAAFEITKTYRRMKRS